MKDILERLFRLREHKTNVRTEIAAGITTFMTMAYILAVNPSVLSGCGMNSTAVLIATCLASVIGTLFMAFAANLPVALSASMGLNAYFAYTVCGSMGYPWQVALFAVFVEGVLFIIMSLTNIREAIFNAIPMCLKKAVSVGIGLFIAFIGLQNAGLAVGNEGTLVSLVSFREHFHTDGICALLAVVGIFVTAILHVRNVKGSMLIGIVATWVLGIFCQLFGIYQPDVAHASVLPEFRMTDFGAIGETFGQCFHLDMSHISLFEFFMVVFAFLFVDLFDTIGTLIGVSSKAGLLDENGKLPAIRPALLSDAISTTIGAVLGTSTTATFVESAAGIGAGGRTGLTALTTAVLFLLSILFAPLFIAIPAFATAPALVMVGFLMFTSIVEIRFDAEHMTEAIPAYLCVLCMPLFYSIAEGIAVGVISYTLLNAATGKFRKINIVMYFLTAAFILKYVFL